MSAKTRKKRNPSGGSTNARTNRSRARSISSAGGARTAGIVAVGVLVLAGIFYASHRGSSQGGGTAGAGKYKYQVGDPGPGQKAPPVRLPSVSGGTFDLEAEGGKTVLLYFQEGVGCQPCWDQLKDINANFKPFARLGVDEIVTIAGNPLGALKQKGTDERISTPILADPGLTVSQMYHANNYGMMGTSADGHTFIVVGPQGQIEWRADYGGSPDYTMYVPVPNLVADIRTGLGQAS